MQTFLPYANFAKSAACLDRMRLGKQRVEVLQLLNAIRNGGGWRNHPAARMWRAYMPALCEYGIAICEEWVGRGYKDTCKGKIEKYMRVYLGAPVNYPLWLGNRRFHTSHRSNLLRKFPEHYRSYWPKLRNDLPYVWPV